MSFSASWLALREPADHRARNRELAEKLAAHLAPLAVPRIVDLGCGSGSNLRALAAVLNAEQDWTLVDYDPALLQAARETLTGWAERARAESDSLVLSQNGKTIRVQFRQADLSRGLAPVLDPAPDLVTAAALFDLCSADFIAQAARDIAHSGAAFYTVLTYDGMEEWLPPHEADADVLAAFLAHQKTDKGFGVSAGPDAPRALRDAFAQNGFAVHDASTPWLLEAPRDAALMRELAHGIAQATQETGRLDPARIGSWRMAARVSARIGHRDFLALRR